MDSVELSFCCTVLKIDGLDLVSLQILAAFFKKYHEAKRKNSFYRLH